MFIIICNNFDICWSIPNFKCLLSTIFYLGEKSEIMPYSTKESAFLTLVMGNMHGLNSDTDIYLQKNHSTSSKVV